MGQHARTMESAPAHWGAIPRVYCEVNNVYHRLPFV